MDIKRANYPAPENAKRVIKERGLKKGKIAERMGMTPSKFSSILEGRRLLKVCELRQMAAALNVDVRALLDERIL